MRLTSLMMYISPPLLFILYIGFTVNIGFSEAAPRVNTNNASPAISRKLRSSSETLETLYTIMPNRLPDDRFGSLTGVTHSPIIVSRSKTRPPSLVSSSATTFQQPTTDPTTPSVEYVSTKRDQITVSSSRTSSASKRSIDAQTSVLTPDKMLQTMVSMVSQRTTNDAWPADSIDTPITSTENSQEVRCNCSSEGVLDPDDCDQSTGQCSCMSGYTGLQCEDCEEGHFTNGTTGCLPCSCDSFGAVNHICDSSGTCVCKTGVYGPKCDDCQPGFFGFSKTGCQPCQCHNHTNYCHPQSGVCMSCLDNTNGPNCEECKPKFYRSPGAATTDACVSCPCSNTSSTGTCHSDSEGFPVCDQCLPGYSGQQCDSCAAGFYRSTGGCVPCDCSGNADPKGPSQICHPETGHCLRCINNTMGSRCHLCALDFVGDARAHNCTRLVGKVIPPPVTKPTTAAPKTSSSTSATPKTTITSAMLTTASSSVSTTNSTILLSAITTQAMLTNLGSPTDNTTSAMTEVSWTQFNIIVLAVIILVVLLLLGFVGGVYTYREYQNRKLNAPFWTIELKEDNISFSSYHDSIPNADVSGLLEDEANEVAPNGQLALTTHPQGNCYKV